MEGETESPTESLTESLTRLTVEVEECPDIPGQWQVIIKGTYQGMDVDLVTQGNDPIHAVEMAGDCLHTAFGEWVKP